MSAKPSVKTATNGKKRGGKGAAAAAIAAADAQKEIEDVIREVPQEYDPRLPIDDVMPDPRNANQGDQGALSRSIGKIGFFGAIVVWWDTPSGEKRRMISAGEHRWKDMKRRGATTIRAFKCTMEEWQHRLILAADNRITRLGLDDPAKQLDNLDALAATVGLDGSGYDDDDVADMRALLSHAGTGDGEDAAEDPTKGELLRLASITIAEPKHQVEKGDIYDLLGAEKRHTLLCVDVFAQFALYAPEVGDDAIFAPYPGVILPLTKAGDRSRLVLVQPDPYMAGHLLDRWAEAHGKGNVQKRGGS
jgi:hypothetical protein